MVLGPTYVVRWTWTRSKGKNFGNRLSSHSMTGPSAFFRRLSGLKPLSQRPECPENGAADLRLV